MWRHWTSSSSRKLRKTSAAFQRCSGGGQGEGAEIRFFFAWGHRLGERREREREQQGEEGAEEGDDDGLVVFPDQLLLAVLPEGFVCVSFSQLLAEAIFIENVEEMCSLAGFIAGCVHFVKLVMRCVCDVWPLHSIINSQCLPHWYTI